MPSDFSASWELCRQRYLDSIKDLNHTQLNFRLHDNSLTIAEMTLHLFGVEIWFSSQIQGKTLNTDLETRLTKAATEGVVNDNPFPFQPQEMTPELMQEAASIARNWAEQIILEPTKEQLEVQLQSALGPIITGHGALARFAFHPGYHHGQVYMITSSPNFPK